MPRQLALAITFVLAVLLGTFARADTTLSVEVGWGERVRAHRWTPVFVTASDSTPRNVVLEAHWPHGGNYAMQVRQMFAIGPTPTTFPLLLPVRGYGYGYQEAVYVLRDAATHKSLAHFPEPAQALSYNAQSMLEPAGSLVGVSGRQTLLQSLQGVTPDRVLGIAYLPAARLPSAAIGYESLDLLVLNQPNLSGAGGTAGTSIDPVQQQAIVDWVRAGGNLIMWPGDDGLPAGGPLLDVLPSKSANRVSLNLDKRVLADAGLAARFGALPAYQFNPEPGAQRIDLLNGKAVGYGRPLGLGRIVLAPVNVANLQFDSAEKGKTIWNPLVEGMHLTLTAEQATAQSSRPNYSNQLSNDDQKETEASMRIADKLGDVPGAGSFGFLYVAIALVAMMFVVGPLDWFVLKRLGRQPWTWVTTTGWIALITFAAISIGYFVKSGDLHYRTLRYVYQVGNLTVASNDMIGTYSPRTRDYTFAADPESWWQPAAAPDFGRSDMSIDLDFHQTYQGNLPEPQRINVWSLRFLREDHVGAGPPVISASFESEPGASRVSGIIKNLTDHPLKNFRIRTSAGTGVCNLSRYSPTTVPATQAASADAVAIAQIPAYSSARFEAVLKPEHPQTQPAQQAIYYYQRDTVAPTDSEMPDVAGELDIRRTSQMDKLIQDGNWACVYAEMVDPPAAVPLNDHPEALQRHWQFLAALVELKQPDQQH